MMCHDDDGLHCYYVVFCFCCCNFFFLFSAFIFKFRKKKKKKKGSRLVIIIPVTLHSYSYRERESRESGMDVRCYTIKECRPLDNKKKKNRKLMVHPKSGGDGKTRHNNKNNTKRIFCSYRNDWFYNFCLDRQIGWKKKKKSLLGTIDKTWRIFSFFYSSNDSLIKSLRKCVIISLMISSRRLKLDSKRRRRNKLNCKKMSRGNSRDDIILIKRFFLEDSKYNKK